jgi:HSP20 family protein
MNIMTKWDPFRELNEFSSRLSNLVGRSDRKADGDDWFTRAEWSPLVDISEDEHEYLLKVELAGVEKDQVKVSVENGMLVISGTRSEEKVEKNRKLHRVERLYGNFVRTFGLPDDADGQKINAEFKNGILNVHLPKDERAKPKNIEIKVT